MLVNLYITCIDHNYNTLGRSRIPNRRRGFFFLIEHFSLHLVDFELIDSVHVVTKIWRFIAKTYMFIAPLFIVTFFIINTWNDDVFSKTKAKVNNTADSSLHYYWNADKLVFVSVNALKRCKLKYVIIYYQSLILLSWFKLLSKRQIPLWSHIFGYSF